MGKSRYKIITEGKVPYFLTCSIVNWLPVFPAGELFKEYGFTVVKAVEGVM
ncbi:MAG: hypothetical protein QM504_07695 [Pseudomonadota bacterium]